MTDLTQARVLIMATDGFEQSELFRPREALMDAGVHVTLASLGTEPIQGMRHDQPGQTITPDATIDQVDAQDYDLLLLPGGVANPDTLRMHPEAVALVRAFASAGKPIAAICHAPWLLIEADVARGKRMTSWPSLRTDLANAGAEVVDAEVVIDGQFITSRQPDDIPAFSEAVLDRLRHLGEG
ncbi:MAG: peptidase C56 [Proteobacteria bacterium SG_bin5]|nr:type 1 glutamine amidotransferase [Sphingomonas sp.]OQW42490.1 MAG: peptidase C56 [Proteobacteria bacterium SG_bin5]